MTYRDETGPQELEVGGDSEVTVTAAATATPECNRDAGATRQRRAQRQRRTQTQPPYRHLLWRYRTLTALTLRHKAFFLQGWQVTV